MVLKLKELIKSGLNTLPYVSTLRDLVSAAGQFTPGHYYSPIPSTDDINRLFNSTRNSDGFADIDFRDEYQQDLLTKFIPHYRELNFPENKSVDYRYYYDQSWFCYSDAILLHCFLKHFQPRRIVEVGSGFSSAVMLDTLGSSSERSTSLTFIEPYPERLYENLRESDYGSVQIFDDYIQNVDDSIFTSLQAGDLLFIDSSHVLKFGSDLQHILFNILPKLSVGVHVHFHDIFYPFEYPKNWIEEGKYWNECYFLRAFLSSNRAWEITLFNDYANKVFGETIEQNMPLCRKNFGGSLYLKKVSLN